MKLSEINFSKDGREYFMDGTRVYVKRGDLFFKGSDINVARSGLFLNFLINEADFEFILPDIKVGDILETTNGKFKIVKIDTPEYPETPSYGAMFLDDCEIQYMSNRLERLLKDIMINCDLIDIIEC